VATGRRIEEAVRGSLRRFPAARLLASGPPPVSAAAFFPPPRHRRCRQPPGAAAGGPFPPAPAISTLLFGLQFVGAVGDDLLARLEVRCRRTIVVPSV